MKLHNFAQFSQIYEARMETVVVFFRNLTQMVTWLWPNELRWVSKMNWWRRGSDTDSWTFAAVQWHTCDWKILLYFARACFWNHFVQRSVSRHPPTTTTGCPPTGASHHPLTNPPFHSSNQDVRLNVRGENNLRNLTSWCVCLSSLHGQHRHLSFHHSADYSTLTSHTVSSAGASSKCCHSHLSLLASTYFGSDTCLLTQTHH